MKAILALLFSVSVVACNNTKAASPKTADATKGALNFIGARMGDSLAAPNQICGKSGYTIACCDDEGPAKVCDVQPLPKIGDIRINDATKMYLDGKLIDYRLTFDPKGYDVMATALATKFGPADTAYTTATGEFRNDGTVWRFADGSLTLSRLQGPGDVSTDVNAQSLTGITEFRRRSTALSDKRKADQAAAAAKDLGR
jgi:hypothetical protein